jgi:hypothetical protein
MNIPSARPEGTFLSSPYYVKVRNFCGPVRPARAIDAETLIARL